MSEDQEPIRINTDQFIAAAGPWMSAIVSVIADAAGDHSDEFDALVRESLAAAMIEGAKLGGGETHGQLAIKLREWGIDYHPVMNFEITGDAADFLAEHGEG